MMTGDGNHADLLRRVEHQVEGHSLDLITSDRTEQEIATIARGEDQARQ